MVLAPIVALGGALRWSRWPRFALGIGTVAFFVTPGWRSPSGLYLDDPLEGIGLSAEDSAALHALMAVGSREHLEFLG